MTTLTHRFLMSSVAVLLAAATTTAMARGPMGCDASADGTPQGPRAEKMQQRMAERHAQHQADLKAKLKLSAEQEAAWAQFVQATQPKPMGAAGAMRQAPADMARLTTPERIDAMQALHTVRAAHMAQRGEAVKTFYKNLSTDQQAVFDAETTRHGMGHRKGDGYMKGDMKSGMRGQMRG